MLSSYFTSTVQTVDGPFLIIADPHAVLAAGWTDDVFRMLGAIHPSLRPTSDQLTSLTEDEALASTTPEHAVLAQAVAATRAFYNGDPEPAHLVPVTQKGGPFREKAWQALRTVSPGDVVSYAEFALLAGNPTAVRAAASTCANNAVALFVPCHRVVRTDGSIGGFGYGADLKERLLRREEAFTASVRTPENVAG